jgi:hypothetical protein
MHFYCIKQCRSNIPDLLSESGAQRLKYGMPFQWGALHDYERCALPNIVASK